MAFIQEGVFAPSDLYFYSGAQSARSPFFYPLSAGHFFCGRDYRVERSNFDSVLLTCPVRGSFSFVSEGQERTCTAGGVAVVDCYHPHAYYTADFFEAYWIHISGGNMQELYRELAARQRTVLASEPLALARVKELYTLIREGSPLSDSAMSCKLYELLTGLFFAEQTDAPSDSFLPETLDFLSKNYGEHISVAELAERAHLSASRFARLFKKQTGTSPYDYLLGIRLAKAKELLKNTGLPVSEIADRTGFAGESNFIYFFKKQEGCSPLKFRRQAV